MDMDSYLNDMAARVIDQVYHNASEDPEKVRVMLWNLAEMFLFDAARHSLKDGGLDMMQEDLEIFRSRMKGRIDPLGQPLN